MEELKFKQGDIVYHKANNLRMVVTNVTTEEITCRLVDTTGEFIRETFSPFELTLNDTSNLGERVQLEKK